MKQNRRNINPIGTRHAILAIVAGNRRILHHQVGRIIQKLRLLLRQRGKRRIRADIILQMLHISHTAQHSKHMLRRPGIAERPRSHAIVGPPLFQPGHDMIVHIGKPSPQQRLHNNRRDPPLTQLPVQILGIRIPRIHLLSMLPVQIIQLYLHKIPLQLILPGQQIIEHLNITMIGKTEITDSSRFPLF